MGLRFTYHLAIIVCLGIWAYGFITPMSSFGGNFQGSASTYGLCTYCKLCPQNLVLAEKDCDFCRSMFCDLCGKNVVLDKNECAKCNDSQCHLCPLLSHCQGECMNECKARGSFGPGGGMSLFGSSMGMNGEGMAGWANMFRNGGMARFANMFRNGGMAGFSNMFRNGFQGSGLASMMQGFGGM